MTIQQMSLPEAKDRDLRTVSGGICKAEKLVSSPNGRRLADQPPYVQRDLKSQDGNYRSAPA